jgi:hypothetical protein
MKKIKYLLVGVATLLFVGVAAAQVHRSLDFLTVATIQPSNTLAFTNNLSSHGWGTNVDNALYTNNFGTRVVVGSSAGRTVNVFQDVPLWTDRNGSWNSPVYAMTSETNDTLQAFGPSYANISVTFFGGTGANTAAELVFVPVPDGVNESTETADRFTFAITPAGATVKTVYTNVPMHKYIGCKALRCLYIKPGDTDASSQLIITDLKLNGFVP